MIDIKIVLGILFIHWLADFVCQSDWMATNKSKDNLALSSHVMTYSIIFVFGIWYLTGSLDTGIKFGVFTFILHFITDYITSRVNSTLWETKQVHYFLISIGFDQWLHYLQLFLTYQLLI